MKLKNKLIPIGTILTTAATLAPVALTSCSSNMVNLINGYRPSIDKAVWEDYRANKDDMLTFYASAVNENPEILAQDIYWGDAADALYRQDYFDTEWPLTTLQFKINELTDKVSNIAVHKRNCKDYASETEETVVYYTLDFDYRFIIDYKSDYGWNTTEDVRSDRTLKVKELPVIINKGDFEAGDLGLYSRSINYAFLAGFLQTDWVLQANCIVNEEDKTIDHSAFTNLEKNGFNWSFTYDEKDTITETSITSKRSETSEETFSVVFDRDEYFDSENEMYELAYMYLAYWYAPIYYLSDITDVNVQLWPVE